MCRRLFAFIVVTLFIVLCLNLSNFAHAGGISYQFPYEKVKKYLLSIKYVRSSKDFNGYYDDGKGNVTVYCSALYSGEKKVTFAAERYSFILLKTDNGFKWLFLSNSKRHRTFIE